MRHSPDLVPEFVDFMRAVHGVEGESWISRLPKLLHVCASEWNLTLGEPFPNLTYNYVVRCWLVDGTPAVLKVGMPHAELFSEMDALNAFAGQGSVRLIASSREHAAMLLDLVDPGIPLKQVEDDDEATHIAARVMHTLWRRPPAQHNFKHVNDLVRGFERLRRRFGGGTGPIPEDLVAGVERLARELNETGTPDVLLHGDLHHDNILDAGDGRWLAIDPKGVVGPPAYEAGALLINPVDRLTDHPDLAALLERRVEILVRELSVSREELRAWGVVKAVLAAWWDIEDNSGDPARWLRFVTALDAIS